MGGADVLERGREAFARGAWGEAYARLGAAAEPAADAADLERLATAAWLTGHDAESAAAWERAHHAHLARGDAEGAARCAFWLGFQLMEGGERARAGGWIARARRLLDDGRRDCVVCGYLGYAAGVQMIFAGDVAAAHDTFAGAARCGERFGDTALVALARHGQGRTLIRQGRVADGVALLDEAMTAVTTGEVAPVVAGDIYCSVIEACHEIYDLRRAGEWTAALGRWCAAQPELVPYRGQCLVRRAELLQLHGAWPDAIAEAERACAWLSRPPAQAAVGAAYYQRAELHRLRGELAEAEAAYRRASERGRSPQPGLALLRLAERSVAAAAASIRRVAGETRDRRARARVLAAYVEIMLAAGDVAAARAGADELAALAAELGAPFLRAVADHAAGTVRLAEGDARGALAALREAAAAWRELDAPYEAARAGVGLALACRALGDEDGARTELAAARAAFARLEAAPDLARVDALLSAAAPAPASASAPPLTARERQVLALVARGETNRAIAGELRIAEKTVARHVANIFLKLDVSTRAAATAYAWRHRLVAGAPA